METELIAHLAPGSLINERFELVNRIARGASGTVIRVRDRVLNNSNVVLKLLNSEHLSDPQQFERFRKEARLMRELTHANIVRVYDMDMLAEELYFISMEYVEGCTLREVLKEEEGVGLPFDEALHILYQLALGIEHAHEHGVVHRDLKPGNILISSDNRVKITDFGLAKTLAADESLTQAGETVGTPYYMSPEQLHGREVDARTDIYSFGILAYELVAGRRPFQDENLLSLASMHLSQPLPKLPAEADAPSWFNDFLQQCTHKHPAQRFQSMAEVATILEGAQRKRSSLRVLAWCSRAPFHRWRRTTMARRFKMKQLVYSAGLLLLLLTLFLVGGQFSPTLRLWYGAPLLRIERMLGIDLSGAKQLALGGGGTGLTRLDPSALVDAVSRGAHEEVQLLLAAGIDPGLAVESGEPVLFDAIESGDPELVKPFIRSGAPADLRDAEGRTPLMRMIQEQPLLAAELLAAGYLAAEVPGRKLDARLELADNHGRTALLHALEAGSREVFDQLLTRGASVFVADSDGKTSLMYAAEQDDSYFLEAIIHEKGSLMVLAETKDGMTALALAKRAQNIRAVNLLLAAGAKWNPK